VNDRSDIAGHLVKVTDRYERIQAITELVGRMDVGAKVKTAKNGDTVITIPKGGK
jgi:hypothetical protein